MPTLLDRAVRPLARRGMLSVTLPPVASVAVPDVQRAAPRTALRVSDQVGAALFRFPQRRGVLPENARHFADTNEFFRAGLNRLKDRVARAERSVEPIDPERPYSRRLQARITWLIENPNPSLASFRTFIEPVVEDLLVLGKGGWENVRNWRGWPLALYPFNAAYMRVNGDWDGTDPRMPRYFWTPVPRKAVPLANDDVTLMLLNPATHRPEGLSPLDTLQASIEADAAANQFIRSMLERYPPPGWLELGNNAGPVQVNAVREKMQTDVLGHGGMLITGGLSDAKFTSLWSGTSRDNELQAWSIYFARKICAVLGVSPQDVGVTFDINRATGETQTDISEESGYESLLNVVNETINREVVAKFGNPEEINLHFQFRHLTLKRREREVEMAGKLTGGVPFTLLNEARDVARLPPLELGNAVYAMTASGPVPFIGDDARAYRRQMAEELAALADEQAQDGALPDPTATPTPDGGAANTNDQASVETDA